VRIRALCDPKRPVFFCLLRWNDLCWHRRGIHVRSMTPGVSATAPSCGESVRKLGEEERFSARRKVGKANKESVLRDSSGLSGLARSLSSFTRFDQRRVMGKKNLCGERESGSLCQRLIREQTYYSIRDITNYVNMPLGFTSWTRICNIIISYYIFNNNNT